MGALKHTCVTSLEEMASYGTGWERLRKECGGPIYSSYPLTMMWLEAFSQMASPRVIVVEDGGELIGVVPLYVSRHRTAGIPVKTLSLIGQGGYLGFNNIGVLFQPDRGDAVREAVAGIDRLEWNVLNARCMEDTWCVRDFLTTVQASWDWQEYPPLTSVVCPLPDTDIMECFAKRTKTRLRNHMNGLDKKDRARLVTLTAEGIDDAIDTYVRQHIERWERKGGSIFLDPRNAAFLRDVLKRSMPEGFGFGYQLLIDDTVAAQMFGFLEGEMARGYMMGMNEEFAKHSPGLVIMASAMKDLRGRGIRVMDMGAGMEWYKDHIVGYKVQIKGLRATRGIVSLLSKVASSPMVKRIDATLGVKQRFFDGVYE
jgi:CelD/BcsL family acetyltransferase involved in cellulose biosynthesis